MENEKKNEASSDQKQENRGNQGNRRNRPRHKRGYFIDPTQAPKESAPQDNKNADQQPKREQENRPQKAANTRTPDQAQTHSENGVKKEDSAPKKKHKRHRSSGGQRPKDGAENVENRKESVEGTKKPQQPQRNDRGRNQPRQERGGASGNDRGNHGGNNQRNRSSDKLIPMKEEKKPASLPMDDEYEEVFFPAEEEPAQKTATPTEEEPAVLVEVVGIRFKNSGKVYYFTPGKLTLKRGDYAIVETARGLEYGEVALGNSMVKESDTVPPLRPIIRAATEADRAHHEDNKKKEEDSFRICNEKIQAHGLDMKLIEAQYTFDNSKLLFYFTSAGRVDFRDLVKDLASVFRTRIELRQIGIRDEAKLMGGMGMCGRPLCCSLFLSDFGQVSIKMAKEQNLSLNSAKISGICGRLMCCLRYEHEAYEYEIKRTPPVDSVVRTVDGNGSVTEINPLVGTIKVRLFASPETPPKTYRREDVIMLKKKGDKNEKGNKQEKNAPEESKEN